MYDSPVPASLGSIEDWILQYTYGHPNDKHSTTSLLQQLDQVLRNEPSQLEECNRIKGIMGAPALSAEEYAARRKPELSVVQRAVETLIKNGWVKGKRESDETGVVFFDGIALTASGEREAISRERERETKSTPHRSYENSLREARKHAGADKVEG
jgi:hypothetical protein